ncbi:MAG TPA: SAP domain-containing protein [Pseudonocardiaceae bacterium]|nr:SAP domain-containing protein [Pseudonocardiaceae bacterium]
MGKTNADGTTYTDPLTEVTTSVNSSGEVTGVTEAGDPTSSLLVTNPITELADDAVVGDSTEETAADEAPVDVDGDGVIDKYEALTKNELVGLCTSYKPNPLPTLGNKADLVRRLQEADEAAAAPVGTGA